MDKNDFPSYKVIFIAILVIAFISNFRLIEKTKNRFFQTNYDWENVEVLKDFDILKIDSISYNYIEFNTKKKLPVNNQNTLKLTSDGQPYYFRFISGSISQESVIYNGVEWLNERPDYKLRSGKLQSVHLSVKRNKGVKVLTFGDDEMIKDEAKYFRRTIATEKEVNFVGKFTDVFGYAHTSSKSYNSTYIKNDLDEFEEAEVYILFWGYSDIDSPVSQTTRNITNILRNLKKRKSTQKIILIGLPNVNHPQIRQYNKELNLFLKSQRTDLICFIDTQSILYNNPNQYLMPNGLYLNKEGYERLAKETSKFLP